MTDSDNDVVLVKHLEALANAARNYADNVATGENTGASGDITDFNASLNSAFGLNDSVQPADGFSSVLSGIFNEGEDSSTEFNSALNSAFGLNDSVQPADGFSSVLSGIFYH